MNEIHFKIIDAWVKRVQDQFLVHPDDMKEPAEELDETNEDSVWQWNRFDLEEEENTYCIQQLEFFMGANITLHHAGLEPFPDMFILVLSVGRKASDFGRKENVNG